MERQFGGTFDVVFVYLKKKLQKKAWCQPKGA